MTCDTNNINNSEYQLKNKKEKCYQKIIMENSKKNNLKGK